MNLTGKYNGYTCKQCGGVTMTYHIDDGVTPMFLLCRATTDPNCNGEAVSMGYPFDEHNPIPEHFTHLPRWEWYRPSSKEIRKMGQDYRDHIMRGGLALRSPQPNHESTSHLSSTDTVPRTDR